MRMLFYTSGIVVTLGMAVMYPALAAEQEPPVMPAAEAAKEQPARLLSAFFGLDNALPFRINRVCFGGSGKDGMPVVFSHTLDADTLQPEDFNIVTRSGEASMPKCVTLRPAQDPGENRTVLMIGEFGSADDDPPASVQIVGEVLSDGTPSVDFNGARVDVTPLAAGPSLVLAKALTEDEWTTKTRSTSCPKDVKQVVRVTWNGGVRLPNGDDPGDTERQLYRVTVERADGPSDEISPVALADLKDRDNNHLLCLDTADPAIAVSFPGGHLVDPNMDLNPDTRVAVSRGGN
ncbi:MAG: hypothetical protein R3308_01980 [Thiohalobacterales bacterium]|nr:hypothetical protein [Thiohalobacterales bacterium]